MELSNITEKDLVRAELLRMRPRPFFAVVGVLIGLFMVYGVIRAIFVGKSYLSLCGFIAVVCYLFFRIRYTARKNYRKVSANPCAMTAKEDGLLLESDRGHWLIKWSDIVKWRYNKKMILLYPAKNSFFVLPRHEFSSEDAYAEFESLVASKCGRAF